MGRLLFWKAITPRPATTAVSSGHPVTNRASKVYWKEKEGGKMKTTSVNWGLMSLVAFNLLLWVIILRIVTLVF